MSEAYSTSPYSGKQWPLRDRPWQSNVHTLGGDHRGEPLPDEGDDGFEIGAELGVTDGNL